MARKKEADADTTARLRKDLAAARARIKELEQEVVSLQRKQYFTSFVRENGFNLYLPKGTNGK